MSKPFRPDTICVQAGWNPKKGEPRVLPIYQSTTFKYDTTEEMGALFDLKERNLRYNLFVAQKFSISTTKCKKLF